MPTPAFMILFLLDCIDEYWYQEWMSLDFGLKKYKMCKAASKWSDDDDIADNVKIVRLSWDGHHVEQTTQWAPPNWKDHTGQSKIIENLEDPPDHVIMVETHPTIYN